MKTLLILLLTTQLFSDIRPISSERFFKNGWFTSVKFKDYCIDGYVWRRYYYDKQGSLSQVLINRDGKALAKECKERK